MEAGRTFSRSYWPFVSHRSLFWRNSMTAARNENTIPSFEILEPRVLLDGDITATLAGSTLVIEGDAQSNAVIVYQQGSGAFVVEGLRDNDTGNLTMVNGIPLRVFSGGVSNVKINMGLGNDELSIGDPGIAITTTIPGNLSIDMGGGTQDGVFFGFDIAAFGYLGDVDIGGNLTIQGSDAQDSVYLLGMSVAKNVTMKLGDSPIGTSNWVLMNRTARSSFIGGKLSITGGDGRDDWTIRNTEITGSAQFKLGETPDGKTNKITIEDSTISGAVKITGGDGREEMNILNSTLSSVSVQLKGSNRDLDNDWVEFSSTTINGNVKISSNGDCDVNILSNSEVYGSLSIRSKSGALLYMDNSSVTGKVKSSSGYASVSLATEATITGDLALKAKIGIGLNLSQASSIDGDVKFSGGSRRDAFRLRTGCVITGSVKINFRTVQDGQDENVYIGGIIFGDLSVTGGDGQERIVIDGIITGNLKMDLKGAPDAHYNFVEIVNGAVVVGDVSIRSKGKFDATLTESQIDGTINMKLGKAADKVEIDDCVFGGSFILDASDGDDGLIIDRRAAAGSNFAGSVTVKMGNGGDLVEIGDVFGVGAGVTFQDECSFDGGSGLLDQFFALDPNYDNNFQLGVPNYTNFEEVS